MKNKFTRLTEQQLANKCNFIENYLASQNAASGAIFDSNANVSTKNIATMEAELNKDINIQINRKLIGNKIEELFGASLAKEYIRQLEEHEIYVHDETSLKPYCVSVSMYPLLLDGLTKLGGESKAPKHLASFCGSFVNFLFSVSSQFAGAVATVEFLLYFDHFAGKDYGENYIQTHTETIENELQHVVYAINQPAAARGYQSVFWNISLYDRPYFDSMFGTFVFPDGSKPDYSSLDRLQQFFMQWFNKERCKAVLTFPVITAAMLTKDQKVYDEAFADFCSKELSEGNSFFIYQSENADSLASCCRLRNEISDNTFSYSLGAGGVSTGSINVITINMNRLYQKEIPLETMIDNIHKYQVAFRSLIQDYKNAGMLPVYDAGFISLDKQFLTIGINGMVEAAEFLGIEISDNERYKNFINENLKLIFTKNKEAKEKYGYMFNTEFVPAENLGVKNAKWDREDWLYVPRDCYNSYFYIVEDESQNLIDKFFLHGNEYIQYLDGGSAYHCNLEEYPTQEGFKKLLNVAAYTGCNYFCFNIKVTVCNSCGYINKKTMDHCTECHSNDIDYATRVIGYLKKVTNFSKDRQKEEKRRYYGNAEV
ncbi:anaerobic ribonucleoside-triphosphate reductase [uncultured Chryseobacterium sp.]|uniref:anaerobic ribonucleoside-triphosphate reductase n=1 Tax=uncultured Chryseobacterium sp. TaxID=259322 RepID=UPI00263001B2|nr:anaerobic ribonucleoside-triphosphate reductase [uncultured Chryseobacterium sp.]